jgi:hypothetical protein
MNNKILAVRVSVLALLLTVSACKSDLEGTEETAAVDSGTSVNSAPSIWGKPQTSIDVNLLYFFQPEASDPDGDLLEFSIANKPEWAQFDPNTGSLQGIAASDDASLADNIVISVTDQNSIVSLASFSITLHGTYVADRSGDAAAVSSPPDIWGTPNTSVVVERLYSFVPEASDADGDALSFSIVNKPTWASFDTTTGRLQGSPTGADVGTSEPIELYVTDGTGIAALSTFTITVEQVGPSSYTLSWNPPTENEDGTPLTDLAGYRIYYGSAAGEYNVDIALDSAGITSYVIDNLSPGTYFLVMTSINSRGVESKYTPEISFELGL